ncbi:unnamed protein product [Rotaria socialis]|uniref:Uncharacterized protein n=1 Tax=Rotaria socialis TaxID=392032 RepID=A0A820XNR2_9BILA|nr:unnamed protein product [Rotaria socialis]
MFSVLFFTAKISPIHTSGIVLSAVIRNIQNTPVQCTIIWSTSFGSISNKDIITVASHRYKVVFEKIQDIDSWMPDAFIQEIHCGDLVLTNPFARVFSRERLWEFRIEPDRIVSVGGSSYVP